MRSVTTVLFALGAAAVAFAQSPDSALLIREGRQVVLQVGASRTSAPFPANAVSCSSQKTIFVHEAPEGRLALWDPGESKFRQISDHAVNPCWSPDGTTVLFGEPRRGLLSVKSTNESKVIADDAVLNSGAWSSDGDRIAFATKDGIYTINADGTNRRRVLKDQPAKAIAWRPSDDSITFVSPGLKGIGAKTMVLANGLGVAHRLVGLDADQIAWSPSGALLLAHTASGWCAYDPAGGRITSIEGLVGVPRWFGSKKLRFAIASGVVTGLGELAPIELFPAGVAQGLIAWSEPPTVEFTNDMIFKSPFAGAALPGPGRLRVEGFIDVADPLKGECSVQVSRIVDPSGKETNFAGRTSQLVTISPSAVRFDGKETTPFRPIDLRSDVHVSLLIEAEKLDPRRAVEASEVWLTGLPMPNLSLAPTPAPRLTSAQLDPDGVSHESVVVPLVFPVLNVKTWSDSFLVNRDGGSRRHLGQDLIAPKMTPIVACFDGIVFLGKPKKAGGHYTLTLKGDNGWIANYYHINNDTPGTDDGMGGDENAYAPGLESGQRVTAGQFIAYVGDSGNAENTVSHLHFELWDSLTKAVVNAAPSLRAATESQPSVSVPSAEIKVLPKEVRYDGIVKEVDAQRKTVVVDVLTETKAGKARAVRTKKTITITIARKTDAFVLGNENIPVACSDLRPGLYAVLVAAPGSNEARIAAFAPREDE